MSTVVRWLPSELYPADEPSRRPLGIGSTIVELCAGAPQVAPSLQRRQRLVLHWDLDGGSAFNLSKRAPRRILRAWLRTGVVWGLIMRVPHHRVAA